MNRVPELEAGKKAVCGKCKASLNGYPVELNDSNFASTIASGNFVVDFWAGWCAPCRKQAPIIEELASEHERVRFGKLDVDESGATSLSFNIRGIPTLIFFRDGAELDRMVGVQSKMEIQAKMAQYFY